MLQYPDEHRARFADFVRLLLVCRNVLRVVMQETEMRPATDSAADIDIRTLSERTPAAHEIVPRLIPVTIETYLYAASEHIGALSALYEREEVLLGPLVLGRSAIEHCAHAIWILGSGHPEPVEGRVARALLDELHGARQALKQTAGLTGTESEDHRQRQETYEVFEAASLSVFAAPIRVKKQFVLGGHSLPGHAEIVVEASRLARTRLADEVIRGTYSLMSNTVHPTPHTIRELFAIERQGEQPTATLNRPDDFHENLVKMVVYFFYNALTYVMSYKGLDPQGHQALTEAIDTLMSDLFVGEPESAPFDSRVTPVLPDDAPPPAT